MYCCFDVSYLHLLAQQTYLQIDPACGIPNVSPYNGGNPPWIASRAGTSYGEQFEDDLDALMSMLRILSSVPSPTLSPSHVLILNIFVFP